MSSKTISLFFLMFVGAFTYLLKSISEQINAEKEEKKTSKEEPLKEETSKEEQSNEIKSSDFEIKVEFEEEPKQKTVMIVDIDGLTANVIKILKENGINTLDDVVNFTEDQLMAIKGIGSKTVLLLKPAK